MDNTNEHNRRRETNNKNTKPHPIIKCYQINLQHSRTATDNLMELIRKEEIDVAFIQEPYIIYNRVVGIPNRYRVFTSPVGKCRTATVVTNNHIDALLVQEATDKDSVVVELILDNLKFYTANMYMDITEKIDTGIQKISDTLQLANRSSILFTLDSNSRSRTWYDKLTNERGKKLEEFLISKQLFILNEESEMKTFQSSRGSSNIDLTISNHRLLKEVKEWKISEEESCSDHKIIQFCIGQYNVQQTGNILQCTKYIVRGENHKRFEAFLTQEIAKEMCGTCWEDIKYLDKYISSQIANTEDMEDIVNKFSEALTTACNKSFKRGRALMKTNKYKTVPWWTEDITIARKRVNAFRRKYQRTKNNNNLREQRQTEYKVEKAQYQAKIKNAKIQSWKQYCNKVTSTNPWNIVYKSAAGKTNNSQIMSTLQKANGLYTEDLRETIQCTLEYLVPKDEEAEETDHHKQVRTLIEEPMDTEDDRDFTTEEIRQIIKSIDYKKAPGEDGITSKILMWTFESFPRLVTSIYNGCLSKGCFPKRWKRARILPILKPG